MRAYRLERLGRTDGVVLGECDDPTPGPTEVVVRVHAASINRRDVMIAEQTYPLPAKPNIIPLSDGAGEVVAVGPKITRFKVGDRVTGSYFPRWLRWSACARHGGPTGMHRRWHGYRICRSR